VPKLNSGNGSARKYSAVSFSGASADTPQVLDEAGIGLATSSAELERSIQDLIAALP
jgi:hypothetical protein